jgi:hypothetical protein
MHIAPHRQTRSSSAFTRPELITISAILLVLLLIMSVAWTVQRRKQLHRICVNNLKNVGLAFRLTASDSSDRFSFEVSIAEGGTNDYTNVWQHFRGISNELSTPKILVCPESYKRRAQTFETLSDQNITYFLGVTAIETAPQSFLAGDTGFLIAGQSPTSNPVTLTTNTSMAYPLSIHQSLGKIAMGDGSVQQLDPIRLRHALTNTSQSTLATNILLLPR